MKQNFKGEDYTELLQNYLSKNTNFIASQDKENNQQIKKDSIKNEIANKNIPSSFKNTKENSELTNIFSSNFIAIFNTIPYLKKLQNFSNQSSSKNNKSIREEGNSILNNTSNSNYNYFQSDKKSDRILHINSYIYSKVILFSEKK